MNVLLLCDDFWHPGEVVTRGLRNLWGEDLIPDVVKAPKDILTAEMLRQYEVIVCARGGAHSAANHTAAWFEEGITAVMPRDLRDYVEQGGGFVALHAGNTFNHTNQPEMADFIGNDFIGHPKQCPVTVSPTGEHPITAGVKPFTLKDEHYRITVTAPDATPILTSHSDSESGTQVAGYVRTMGKGRVCCLMPGHNCSIFENPEYSKTIRNAILWCAGQL